MIGEILAKAAEVTAETVKEVGTKVKEGFEKIKPEKEMSAKELTKGVKEEFEKAKDEARPEHAKIDTHEKARDDKEINTLISPEERRDYAKRSNGEWSGEVGESKFRPENAEAKDILKKLGQESVEYRNGDPDFSKVSAGTVKIDNMTSDRPSNFRQANEALAKQWNDTAKFGRTDWTARDIDNWRSENKYSWHEQIDMKTMDLVPRAVHEECKHIGGVAECKRHEGGAGGFDE